VEKPFKCSKCDKCFRTSEDHNQHELTHSNKKALLQQVTDNRGDTSSYDEDQGKGFTTESKADASHTEPNYSSSEDHILCNDVQIGAVEKPCSEQSLAQMEHELASNEEHLCYQSQLNVDNDNIEQGSCTSVDHSRYEQCDTSEKPGTGQLQVYVQPETELASTCCSKSMMQSVCLQPEPNAETEVRMGDFHSSEMTSVHYCQQTGVGENDCTEQAANTREHDLSSDEK